MKYLAVPKPLLIKLLFAFMIVALAIAFACRSDSEEDTVMNTGDLECPDLVDAPDIGGQALGPPPALPNIFTGTVYVDGDPAPEGELLYIKLAASRSKAVKILENGKFRDIIHGPVSALDQGVQFVFCLGDPEGRSVKSAETFEFDGNEPFKESDVELNFPMLPSELK